MKGNLPFERLFSIPALEGARSLRDHLMQNPSLTLMEAVSLIGQLDLVEVEGLDVEAGQAVVAILPANIPNDGALFYRGCIRHILLTFQPVWIRTMLQGRRRLYEALERDEQSLFRQAGLLDDPPDDAFVEWWDTLSGELRLVIDFAKLTRGRIAEKLSFELEKSRVLSEGIAETVRWTGLDDNTKGYDILSYEWVDGAVRIKLIEVKSTIASPLRFRLTRNEWDQANRVGEAYVFHIWDLQQRPPILHIRTVEQVRPHIPSDNDKGKWKDAEIPVGI